MKANKREQVGEIKTCFFCLREKPLQCDEADKVVVFLSEVGGGGGR